MRKTVGYALLPPVEIQLDSADGCLDIVIYILERYSDILY